MVELMYMQWCIWPQAGWQLQQTPGYRPCAAPECCNSVVRWMLLAMCCKGDQVNVPKGLQHLNF